jgi:flagellar biosynthetic protein FliR
MLEQLIPQNLFAFFLVFARIGAVLMLMPGFGESFVPARLRLIISLAVSLVVLPIVASVIPAMPATPIDLLITLGKEIIAGLFIGAAARTLMTALQAAGMVAAYQSSLANALVTDPASQQQGALAGSFLSITATLLIFVTDLHHVMLGAIVDSYGLFVPGQPLPVGDLSAATARVVGQSFVLAVQVAAPFIVVGLLFSVGVGLLNRLMPQVQMFFIVMPLQVFLGVLLLMITASSILLWFMNAFGEGLRTLFTGG